MKDIEVLGQITDEPGWVIRLPEVTSEALDRLCAALGERTHPVLVLPLSGSIERSVCPECNDTGMIRLGEDDGLHEDVACLRCNLEGGA